MRVRRDSTDHQNYGGRFIVKVEVASDKSTVFDMADIDDDTEKERTPKGQMTADLLLGHTVKSRMTVINF